MTATLEKIEIASKDGSAGPGTGVEGPTLRVGDFFYSSWGYDQTNVDFYKVVGFSASGKSVKVQKWSSRIASAEDAHFSEEVVVPGEYPATWLDWSAVPVGADYWERQEKTVSRPAPVQTFRLKTGGWKDFAFTVNSYSSAFKWDGAPQRQTAAGYGH